MAGPFERVGKTCAAISLSVGLLGMAGWALGTPALTSVGPGYVPTSVEAALSLVLTGIALLQATGSEPTLARRWFVALAALAALILNCVDVVEVLAGSEAGAMGALADSLGIQRNMLLNRPSPVSSVCSVLVGLGLLGLLQPARRSVAAWAPWLAVLVVLVNFVVLVGYMYGTPLLYGGAIRPVGVVTALGFMALGSGLLAAAGPGYLPVSAFLGGSVRARLLRTFLPITFVVVLLAELFFYYLRLYPLTNQAAHDALQAMLATAVVTLAIFHVARLTGRSLDAVETERAQALEALQRAQDESEARVAKRTEQLARANAHLREEIVEHRQTEQALRESETKLRRILSAMPDYVVRVGKDGMVLDFKPPGTPCVPVAPGAFIDSNLAELLPADLAAQALRSLTHALDTGNSQLIECQHGIGGELREFEARVVPAGQDEVLAFVHETTEVRRLEREILEISSREQKRLGEDLHDGLSSHLTGVAFLSKALEQRLAARSSPDAAEAAQIRDLVVKALNQTQRIARGLLPYELLANGLAAGLRELCSQLEAVYKISCRCHCEGEVRLGDSVTPLHLYRIAQEACNNAVKHGQVAHIALTLSAADMAGKLVIQDDGVGFDEAERDTKGLGLRTMRYRAKRLGGVLEVRSAKGKGTTVTCWFRTQPAMLPNPGS